MKAVLEINKSDLNMHLVNVLTALFNEDVTEIVLKKSSIQLDEFEGSLKLDDVMKSLKEYGHNELLLKDIEKGLQKSSVYKK